MASFSLKPLSLGLLFALAGISANAAATTYIYRQTLPIVPTLRNGMTNYTFTKPGLYHIPVPAGGTEASVTVIGGAGGARFYQGGSGAEVTGVIPLSGISTLTVIVGGGGGGGNCTCGGGGGGGGLSAICSGSSCTASSALIIAAGGGGGNGDTYEAGDTGFAAVSPDGNTTSQGGGAGGLGFGGNGLGEAGTGIPGVAFSAGGGLGTATAGCSDTPPSSLSTSEGTGVGGYGGGGGGGIGMGGGGGGGGYPGGSGGNTGVSPHLGYEGGNGGASFWSSSVKSPGFHLADNQGASCSLSDAWGAPGGTGSVTLGIS